MSQEQRPTRAGGTGADGDGDGTRSAASYAGLGLQFAASILVFLFAGQWLDRRLNARGLCTALFVLLGAGASFYSLYRQLTGAQRRADERRRQDGGAGGP